MARKYTKFECQGNMDEIRRILKLHHRDGRYVRFNYTRDDRIVDLDTGKVMISDEFDQTGGTYMFSFSDRGYTVGDSLRNARYDETENQLYVKSVHATASEKNEKSGVIYLILKELPVFNFSTGRVQWSDHLPSEEGTLAECLSCVEGLEYLARDIEMVENAYKHVMTEYMSVFRVWFLVQRFNLYDKVEEFSKIIKLETDGMNNFSEDHDDFFEMLDVAPEFMFALSDLYIGDMAKRSFYYNNPADYVNRSSCIYQIYEKMEDDECKKALLNGAELRQYNLANIAAAWNEITQQEFIEAVNENPKFFVQYISRPLLTNQEDVLGGFTTLCESCKTAGLFPSAESISHLELAKKAEHFGLTVDEYVQTLNSLETKEGLIAFYKSIGN